MKAAGYMSLQSHTPGRNSFIENKNRGSSLAPPASNSGLHDRTHSEMKQYSNNFERKNMTPRPERFDPNSGLNAKSNIYGSLLDKEQIRLPNLSTLEKKRNSGAVMGASGDFGPHD